MVDNWTGTGTVENSGDTERICLAAGEYMEGEVVETDGITVELLQNQYSAGDNVVIKYRTEADLVTLAGASWITYTVPFVSDVYTQIRIEATP